MAYNQALKEAMVASKKEYDDVGRQRQAEQIQRVKDNPEALHKQTTDILDRIGKSPAKL